MDDLSNLWTEIEISKGNIIICMVDTPVLRDNIIEKLSKKFNFKKIQVENGRDIIRTLKKEKNKSSQKIHYDAILWIMPEEVDIDILNALNIFRELFYDINVPSLIFCNRNLLDTFIRQTPDFWRYRGNYYEFESDERFQTFFRDTILEPPFSYRDKDDLLRKKRIIEYVLGETEDNNEKGNLYEELAFVYWILGETNEVLKYFRKALDINREMNNNIGEAHQLGNIGLAYRDKGEADKALKHFKEALRIHRKKGHRVGEAHQLGNIGLAYRDKGEADKALKHFKEALKIEKEIGYKQGEAHQLGNIGLAYRDKGKLDDALKYYKYALEIEKEIGYKQGEAYQLRNIGLIYKDKGEMNKALKHFEEALELDRKIGYKKGEADQLGNIGMVLYNMGEREKSLNYFNEALHAFEDIGTKAQAATVRNFIMEKIPDETKRYKAKNSK